MSNSSPRPRRGDVLAAPAFRAIEQLERRVMLTIFTVTNTGDNGGANPTVGAGTGTLRQAIVDSNAGVAGTNAIHFDIPGSGVHLITLSSSLPEITQPVNIDGTSQPGFNTSTFVPVVEVSGDALPIGPGFDVLEIATNNSSITGLDVVGSLNTITNPIITTGGTGIAINQGDSDTISGDYIGIDLSNTSQPQNFTGIEVESGESNTIGGITAAARNVISGNTQNGVELDGGSGNVVEGNYIGTDSTGTEAMANGGVGIDVNGGSDTVIGGITAAARNVISANAGGGIFIAGSQTGAPANNAVEGNYVGSDVTGTKALGNGGGSAGVNIVGDANDLIQSNLIVSNAGGGVNLDNSANVTVTRNYIGTDASGTLQLGNVGVGVLVSSGFAAVAMPASTDNLIGGTTPAAGNVIAFNSGAGVAIGPGFTAGSTNINNAIRDNSIYGNQGLGIDLGDVGVTGNSPGGPHVGADDLQNTPVLASAVVASAGGVTVLGSLNSTPSSFFLIDFYTNSSLSAGGALQGKTYLSTIEVTTDSSGNATINTTIPVAVPAGQFITATASTTTASPFGDTSEFAGPVTITSPIVVTPPPPTPTGSLSGSQVTAATSYNLTTQGPTDWIHWGRGGVFSNVDRKASGGSQISNFTEINPGGASFGAYADSSRSVSWTDGSPVTNEAGDDGYIWANNAVGAGYSFTVPAGTGVHTLFVYAGGYDSGATLTATLSDSSAAPYVASASGSSHYTQLYTITYNAASNGQTLTVSYVKTSGGALGGSVDLISAAVDPPAADTTPPKAVVVSPALISTSSSSAYTFTVDWTDNVAISAATLGNMNLLITGPDGFSRLATLLSSNLANGSSVAAKYSVAAPTGGWTSGVDGTYTVAVQTHQVADTSGNYAAAGSVGSFSVLIPRAVAPKTPVTVAPRV